MTELLFLGIIFLLLTAIPLHINVFIFAFLFPFNYFALNIFRYSLTYSDVFFFVSILQTLFTYQVYKKGDNKKRKLQLLLFLTLFGFVLGNLWVIVQYPTIGSLVEFFQRSAYVFGGLFLGGKCGVRFHAATAIKGFLLGSLSYALLRFLLLFFGDLSYLETQKNSAGLIMALAFAISIAFYSRGISYRVFTIIFGMSTFLTLSRSSIVAVIVVLCLSLIFSKDALSARVKRTLLFASLTAPFIVFLSSEKLEYLVFWNRNQYGRFDYQVEARRTMNQKAIELFNQNRISGYGYGGENGLPINTFHNVLSQSAVEGGILLLITTLFLFFAVSIILWKLRKSSDLHLAVLLLWVTTISHALLDSYWTRGRIALVWFFVGIAFSYLHSRNRVVKFVER